MCIRDRNQPAHGRKKQRHQTVVKTDRLHPCRNPGPCHRWQCPHRRSGVLPSVAVDANANVSTNMCLYYICMHLYVQNACTHVHMRTHALLTHTPGSPERACAARDHSLLPGRRHCPGVSCIHLALNPPRHGPASRERKREREIETHHAWHI